MKQTELDERLPDVEIDEHAVKARLWRHGARAGLLMAVYAYTRAAFKGAKANHHWDETVRGEAAAERDKWLIVGIAATTAGLTGTILRRINEAKSLAGRLSRRVEEITPSDSS